MIKVIFHFFLVLYFSCVTTSLSALDYDLVVYDSNSSYYETYHGYMCSPRYFIPYKHGEVKSSSEYPPSLSTACPLIDNNNSLISCTKYVTSYEIGTGKPCDVYRFGAQEYPVILISNVRIIGTYELTCKSTPPKPDDKIMIKEFSDINECLKVQEKGQYKSELSDNNYYINLQCWADSCGDLSRYYLFGNLIYLPCQEPDTNYPNLSSNEQEIFHWNEDNNRSDECLQLSGDVQNRQVSCETEYRCVKTVEKDPDECRNLPINSYVSPTAGVFHEDIALVGTDVALHYQSAYLNDTSLASGWSLDIHHSLDGDYLHMGSGKYLNVKEYKTLNDDNGSIVKLDNEEYIFDSNNLHIETKDTYTGKTLYTFAYNTNGKLISITDRFANVTTLQRDADDKVTSITSPYQDVNYFYIDENNDLINITYEDNSAYSFTYTDHLMTSEKEANGNEFFHEFDTDGRVVKVVDAVNGIWNFTSTLNDTFTETTVTKADGDVITYKDYFLDNGSMVTKTIIASGDTYESTTSIDESSSTANVCGVETTITYQTQKDPITNKKVPSSITVTTPNGLTNTTTYTQEYTFDANNTVVKKESSSDINGATTTILRDYNNSTTIITSPESRITTITYDQDTQLPIQLQVGDLKPMNYKYDAKGRIKKIAQGARRVKYIYDDKGNVAREINLQTDTTTSYTYDQKNRVISTTYPDGSTISFAYDKNGNMTRLTTPTPTEFAFGYNGVNKKTSLTSPLGYTTHYEYDKQRRVTKITRPSSKTITNIYNQGRLQSITTDEGVTQYAYSCGDKVGSITNADETLLYTYDGDLLTSKTTQGTLNQSINYTYNNNFEVISATYAGVTDNYIYDNDGLLISSGAFTLTRDSINGQVTEVSDTTLNISKTYNAYGELKKQTDENFVMVLRYQKGRIAYKKEKRINFLPANNKKGYKKQRSLDEYNYTYDLNGRLVTVEKNNQVVESYTYDNNSNRISATINGVTTQATYDQEDGIDTYGDNTYTYDTDGQLNQKITSEGITTYSYNSKGTLTKVVTPTNTIEYILNPLGQRVAKKVDGQITEKYLWADLTTLLAIYDGNDNLVQRYNYTDNRVPTSLIQDGETYYLHYDQVGTLKAISDTNHNIVKEISYDTYGNILQDSNPNFTIPFGFAGGLYDQDTNLVHFGYREYDPYIGKWTTKDPIDFNGGDSNLYGYVLNDPINFIDPWGLSRFDNRNGGHGQGRTYDGNSPSSGFLGMYDMWDYYNKMKDANTKGSDKYFHCLANCHATNRGEGGKSMAEFISDFREWYQEPFDGADACEADQVANRQGRKGGNCADTCKQFKPSWLPDWVEQ